MIYERITPPTDGEKITIADGILKVPDNPIIPFIRGDGTGVDITPVVRKVVDAAVKAAYGGKRKITWFKVFAGDEGREKYAPGLTDEELLKLDPNDQRNLYLPQDTLNAFNEYLVGIKGPLTTPIGKGFRSLNVAIRQKLDLYACVRPVKCYEGVPTRVTHPEELDMVIFRENSEDVYSGIEYEEGSKEAAKIIGMVKEMGGEIRSDSGIGVKPISISGSKRLVRAAIQYAIDKNLPSVTLVHKGNIMKFTEGAFMKWGYDVAVDEFRDKIVTEKELWDQYDGKIPEGKILINDRIADIMFQLLILRTGEFSVLATMNLNGDYLSDAAAAVGGGIGMAPGANINYKTGVGVFEATHGTAPKHAGKDRVNPGSLLLSASMMLDYMCWDEASDLIRTAIQKTILQKKVTYDLERQMKGATLLKCSEYGDALIANMS